MFDSSIKSGDAVKLFLPFVILSCVLGVSSTRAFERGTFGPFQRSLNHTPYGYQLIKDPTGEAPTPLVERFEVRAGDCFHHKSWDDCSSDRERSELAEKRKVVTEGTMQWYGWSLFIPKDFADIYPTKVSLGQFHQEGTHPAWMFQLIKGKYLLEKHVNKSAPRYQTLIDEANLRGKWHRLEMQVTWSKAQNGLLRVWIDGRKMVDYAGQTQTASKSYFKYGLYRSFISRYKSANQTDRTPTQTVYFANVRRATNRQGLRPVTK